MFCCDFPDPLPAPTARLEQLRQYCYYMGIGLCAIGFFNILIGDLF
jgi:hypothetical protein